MSITDLNYVDILLEDVPDELSITLIITDHLDWSDPAEHVQALQNKLNYYIDVIKENNFENLKHRNSKKYIRVLFKNELMNGFEKVMEDIKTQLSQNQNIELLYEISP